jgi:Domain of unknown function (DUF4956)
MPLVRLAVYYALVLAGGLLLARFLPQVWHALAGGNLQEVKLGGRHGELSALTQGGNEPTGMIEPEGIPQPVAAALPMIAGTLLVLPVAWVYVMTRERKANAGSTVQTIMLLPAVVAGVAILVRNSLPLAFSLAGIAAAINYRTRIRQPQDEVYVFLAIVMGLASGLQVISIAFAVSLVFNLLVITLTSTEFGRTAGALDGISVRPHLAGHGPASAGGHNGGAVDTALSPDHDGRPKERAVEQPLDTVLRVYTRDPEALRPAVEGILATQVKAWRFERVVAGEEPEARLEYRVRLRKRVPGPVLVAQVQGTVRGADVRAELV